MAAMAEHKNVDQSDKRTGLVYVMTNQSTGNAVTVLGRDTDGGLTRRETFSTGGLGAGGVSAPLDPLLSQGSLILSEDHRFLFAVDAGSDEISVLAVEGEKLIPVDRVACGGVRPVSLTVHQDLLYVLHSTDGTVTGFTVQADGTLRALAGSTQTLIGATEAGPAQVAFTPDGTRLVVTERANNLIDVLALDEHGRARPPVRNDSSGPRPFGFAFAGQDLLIVSEASGATSSYRVSENGTLSVVSGSVATNQAATCWVATSRPADDRYAYVSNAVSGSISGYRIDRDGALSLMDPDGRSGVTAGSHAPIDSITSDDGRFLYVLTGGFDAASDMPDPTAEMAITAFRIESDGSLTTIPGLGGFPPGTQGIAAVG